VTLTAAIYLATAGLLAHKVARWMRGVKHKPWPFTKDFI
jgi:hypothetical protein